MPLLFTLNFHWFVLNCRSYEKWLWIFSHLKISENKTLWKRSRKRPFDLVCGSVLSFAWSLWSTINVRQSSAASCRKLLPVPWSVFSIFWLLTAWMLCWLTLCKRKMTVHQVAVRDILIKTNLKSHHCPSCNHRDGLINNALAFFKTYNGSVFIDSN